MYAIELTKDAIRTLRRMPQNIADLIRKKLDLLAANPHVPNNNVTALKGMDGAYRLRVQDWRVIYRVHDDRLVIVVVRIGPQRRRV